MASVERLLTEIGKVAGLEGSDATFFHAFLPQVFMPSGLVETRNMLQRLGLATILGVAGDRLAAQSFWTAQALLAKIASSEQLLADGGRI
jgi:hypothetical protein